MLVPRLTYSITVPGTGLGQGLDICRSCLGRVVLLEGLLWAALALALAGGWGGGGYEMLRGNERFDEGRVSKVSGLTWVGWVECWLSLFSVLRWVCGDASGKAQLS